MAAVWDGLDAHVAGSLVAAVEVVAGVYGAAACSVALLGGQGGHGPDGLDGVVGGAGRDATDLDDDPDSPGAGLRDMDDPDGTDDGDTLRLVAAHGRGERAVVGTVMPPGQGIVSFVAASGTALVVADVGADPRFARQVAERTGYVPTTILAAPLVGAHDVVGVTEVLDPTLRVRDIELLGAFGVLLAGMLRPAPEGRLAAAVATVARQPRAEQDLAADLLDVLARSAASGRR